MVMINLLISDLGRSRQGDEQERDWKSQKLKKNIEQFHPKIKKKAQLLAYMRPDPVAPGSIPSDVAEVIQRRCLEESGLNISDRTHLVMASGKNSLASKLGR